MKKILFAIVLIMMSNINALISNPNLPSIIETTNSSTSTIINNYNNENIIYFDSGSNSLTTDNTVFGTGGKYCTASPIDCSSIIPTNITINKQFCQIEDGGDGDSSIFQIYTGYDTGGGYADSQVGLNCTTLSNEKYCEVDQNIKVEKGYHIYINYIEESGITSGHGACSLVYTID